MRTFSDGLPQADDITAVICKCLPIASPAISGTAFGIGLHAKPQRPQRKHDRAPGRDEGLQSQDVPYAKGELGRRELQQFILKRHAGQLEYEESMLQAMQRDMDPRRGRRLPPKREFRRYGHILVPDRERQTR